MIILCWSSNSKYSLLGSLRGIAQTISYEVRIALIALRCFLVKFRLSFNYIYYECFALIFIAEYLNIIIISLFRSLMFMPIFFTPFFNDALLILYTLFFSFVFIWVRGRFPRFRYDQLIGLTWKSFLPFSLGSLGMFLGLYIFL